MRMSLSDADRREPEEEVAPVARLRWGQAEAETRVFVVELVLLGQQLDICLDEGFKVLRMGDGDVVIM